MIELHSVGALFGSEGVHKFAFLSLCSHHSGNRGVQFGLRPPLNKCELPRNQTVSLCRTCSLVIIEFSGNVDTYGVHVIFGDGEHGWHGWLSFATST